MTFNRLAALATFSLIAYSSMAVAANELCTSAGLDLFVVKGSYNEANFCDMPVTEVSAPIAGVIQRIGIINKSLEGQLEAAGLKLTIPAVKLYLEPNSYGYFFSSYLPKDTATDTGDASSVTIGVFPNWEETGYSIHERTYVHELGHFLTDYAGKAFGLPHLENLLMTFTGVESFADWIMFFTEAANSPNPAQYPACAEVRSLNTEYSYNTGLGFFLGMNSFNANTKCCQEEIQKGSESDFVTYICPQYQTMAETVDAPFDPTTILEYLPDDLDRLWSNKIDSHQIGLPLASALSHYALRSKTPALQVVAEGLSATNESNIRVRYNCKIKEFPSISLKPVDLIDLHKLWAVIGSRVREPALWSSLEEEYSLDKFWKAAEIINQKNAEIIASMNMATPDRDTCYSGSHLNGKCTMECMVE